MIKFAAAKKVSTIVINKNMFTRINPYYFFFSICVIAGLSNNVFAQKIEVGITTIQQQAVISQVSKIRKSKDVIYAVTLTNTSSVAQNLNVVNITIRTDQRIADSTSFMIGADEMLRKEGNMLQYKTGQTIRSKDNNMYLLFKKAEADYMLIGVISWRTFLCRIYPENGIVKIEGDGDNKMVKAGEKLAFEKIAILKGKSWQDLLSRYADAIARENNVAAPPAVNWEGWATWDYYKQYFTAAAVEKNMHELQALHTNSNIIQIDGGWWKQRGDYFDARDNLPGGIKSIIEKIHQQGFKAGLHFDGFRASAGSNIVKQHPEYFLHTADGKFVELDRDKVTNDPQVIWDYSHPGAQEYITSVMRNARENWKVDYFKIDFMRQGLTKGISFKPVTNVERYRMGVEAMRKGIADAYFLACSPNFGVNIGLIEATRTGPDIDPDYDAIKIRAQHNSGSYYFAEKLYNCDPDYLVVRSEKESDKEDKKKASLTKGQAQMWANYVAIFGNVRLASDKISLLSKEKKEILKQSFDMPFFVKCVPLDLWVHFNTDSDAPRFYLAKTAAGGICLGIFNWDDQDANFNIKGFKANASFTDYLTGNKLQLDQKRLTVLLQGVHSILLQYQGGESFEKLREHLSISSF